jgi:hypothetical protein
MFTPLGVIAVVVAVKRSGGAFRLLVFVSAADCIAQPIATTPQMETNRRRAWAVAELESRMLFLLVSE